MQVSRTCSNGTCKTQTKGDIVATRYVPRAKPKHAFSILHFLSPATRAISAERKAPVFPSPSDKEV